MIQFLSQQNPEIFHNTTVLVRLDLNVPLIDGRVAVSDAGRIHASIPTLEYLRNAGARTVIVSHIGRESHETLRPVADFLNTIIPVDFVSAYDTNMQPGDIVMLENLRQHPGEETNDSSFVAKLVTGIDYYVNDAFAVCHRTHASVVGVPQVLGHTKCFAGFQLEREIHFLDQGLHPQHPAVLIMGGAKFETKLPVITSMLPQVGHVIMGGALLNNFLVRMGYEIGKSLVDEHANIDGLISNEKIIIPQRVISQGEQRGIERDITEVLLNERIVDIAPSSFDIADIADVLHNAKTIIWNGPMGNYENGYTAGTEKLIRMIAGTDAMKIIGGGDSVALIEQLHLSEKFDFLSTGGGAMLEYLAQNGSLPGIAVLQK